MNRTVPIGDSAAAEQASLWAARLAGGALSGADRAELSAWLEADPARRTFLDQYRDLSADLDIALPALAAAGRIEVPASRVPAGISWNPWKLAAAGLCAAALTAAVVWSDRSGMRPESLSAPAGERRTFTLDDGSRVELNANTSLLVENGPGERRVRLANGEAFFEVSKDKARPFIVETPAGSVRVTGTKFSVLTETVSQLDVTVVEGSVRVSPGASAPVVLGPGDHLAAEDGGVALRGLTAGELEDALAWRNGRIVCEGMPLAAALARFAHYNGCVITATPGASVQALGGRYSLGNLDGFLAQLEEVLPVRVAHQAGGAIRVSLRSEP